MAKPRSIISPEEGADKRSPRNYRSALERRERIGGYWPNSEALEKRGIGGFAMDMRSLRFSLLLSNARVHPA
jgi:hypothetical protein